VLADQLEGFLIFRRRHILQPEQRVRLQALPSCAASVGL
jgi:hypothetical protein